MSRPLCLLLLALMVASVTARLKLNCLYCMCRVSSDGCKMPDPLCSHSYHCGPWAIGYGYWIDGGELGDSFRECAGKWYCSMRTVQNYMERYVDDDSATCEQYAKVHMGGPWGTGLASAQRYWEAVNECLSSL